MYFIICQFQILLNIMIGFTFMKQQAKGGAWKEHAFHYGGIKVSSFTYRQIP